MRALVDVVVCRCVLELHAIAAKKAEVGGEIAVAMPAREKLRFLRGIIADCKKYYRMLSTVNLEASDCSRLADRLSIHDGIRSSIGFDKLSRMVFGVLEEWMNGQLRSQAVSFEKAGEDSKAMNCYLALSRLLFDQGRHDNALAMEESVLELRRRVLPEDHPDICEDPVHVVCRL